MTDDLVDVAKLTPIERAYCKRADLETGRISRRLLDDRRRAAEGRGLADLRRNGQQIRVRRTVDRSGEPRMMTTEAVDSLDPAGRSR